MKKAPITQNILKRSVLSLAIITAIHSQVAFANPTGAQIVNGQVSIDSSVPGVMNITNTPGAIINWQNFSIAKGDVTRFIQQSSQSAVLNRVIGKNPSQIMGQLISNGQVYLINPNGVVFGAGALIDTQGLIVSTLNISDSDFQRGNYHFIAGSEAGNILNEGVLRVGQDGNIVLIAPDIKNNGIIQTDGGKIVLAAGQQLTLTSLDDPQIHFEMQSPDNEVLNLGQMLTHGGAIDLFAGTLVHSGQANTESMSLDASGNITFNASNITISGDVFANSDTTKGASIKILGDTISQTVSSTINASGSSGGRIDIIADDILTVKGTLLADGGDGFIETSAPEIDVNGVTVSAAGGEWLIDPTDITIEATTCTGTNCIDAATISSTLANTNVSIATDAAGADSGDITVNANITKASGTGATTLTLSAHNDINIDSDITTTASTLNLTLEANKSDGSGSINFSAIRTIDLNGGNLTTFGGATPTAASAVTNIQGNNLSITDLVWDNSGTLNFNVSDATTFLNFTNATLNNSGTFNDNANSSSYAFIKTNGTTDIINNSGTWNKLGTAATTINTVFNNTGNVNIDNKDLYLTGTGTDTGSYTTSSSNSSLLHFGASSRSLNTGASLSGNIAIYQGSTTFNTNLSIDTLSLNPSGNATLNIRSSTLTTSNIDFLSGTSTITGGGTGTLSIPSGGTIDASAGGTVTAQFDNLTINNSGTFNFTAGTVNIDNNSNFNNFGLFDFRADLNITTNDGTPSSTFNNYSSGTIKKSIGVGTSTIGILMGTNSGTIDLGATNTSLSLPNNGSAVTLSGGKVIGQGGLIANIINTGATISPASTGTVGFIDITGSYTQTSGSGKLELEATSAGTADSILVSAPSSIIAGTIELINLGYTPSINDTFNLFQCSTSTCLTISATINDFSGVDSSSTSIISTTGELFRYTVDTIGSIWTGDAGDFLWSSATNWSTAPTTSSNVYIPSGEASPILYDATAGSLSIGTFDTDSSFSLSGGSLTVSSADFAAGTTFSLTGGQFAINDDSNALLNGNFTWTDGTLARGAAGSSATTLTISDSSVVSFNTSGNPILNGINLTTDSLTIDGNLTVQSGNISTSTGDLTIGSNGSVNITTSNFNAGNRLVIDGDLTIANGDLGAESGVSVSSTGSITISGSPSISTLTNQGTITSSGTPTFNNSFTNQGTFNITAGTSNIDFYGSFSQSSGSTTIASGAALSNGGGSNFSFTGGNLSGAGTLTGNLDFDNGTFSTGSNIGTFDINGNVILGSATTFTIKLGGTTAGQFDQINIVGSATLAGTLNITPIAPYSNVGTPQVGDSFDIISASSGISGDFTTLNTATNYSYTKTISATLFNLTALTVPDPIYTWTGPTSGTVLWNNPANWGGALPPNGADVSIPFQTGNLTIQYTSGTLSLNSLTANESIAILGGSLILGDAIADTSNFASGTNFSLSGGTFGGAGTTNILGAFNWTGGTLSGAGNLDLSSATSLNLNGTLTQAGMNLTFPAGTLASGTTYNLTGGTFNTGNTVHNAGATMNVNGGTFKSTGNVSINGDLNWSSGTLDVAGTVTIGSTGVITISGDNTSTQSTVVNNGTLKKTGGTGTSTISTSTFTNAGTVEATSGTLNFGTSYTQTAGITTLNGGNIQATTTTLNGGSLTGTGTVTGNLNNNATVAPGFSPGTVTVTGNFVQGSTGVLNMEIASTTAGQYDQINVGGSATLAGTLNITPIAPYSNVGSAQVDDSFNFITANSGFIGDFTTINTTVTGYNFTPTIGATAYNFVTAAVPVVPVITQPVVNNIVDLQTTDVVILTKQGVIEQAPPEQQTTPTEEEQAESNEIASTTPIQEIDGALLICQ